MIYFDENKQACSRPENSVAQIDDEVWAQYAGTDKWDIINGEFADITDTSEYAQKELERLKSEKLAQNAKALQEKSSLHLSLGNVNINTPIGRVDVMANGFLNLVNITKSNLPEGAFRIYDADKVEQPSPELTPVQVGEFYVEVFNKFNEIDKRYKQTENAICNVENREALEKIEINYDDI